eukprot:3277499-Prorocentrum_lima.AAC.1
MHTKRELPFPTRKNYAASADRFGRMRRTRRREKEESKVVEALEAGRRPPRPAESVRIATP